MVREVRPARPPDKFNIREVAVQTIVLIEPARIFQASTIRATGILSTASTPLHRTLQRRQHRRFTRGVTAVGKVIGETKTAARRTDLPQHRGEGHQHPVFCSPNCWRCIPSRTSTSWCFYGITPPVRGVYPQKHRKCQPPILPFWPHHPFYPSDSRRIYRSRWYSASGIRHRASRFPPVWAIPSIIATSVPICGAIHSALSPKKSGFQSASGQCR